MFLKEMAVLLLGRKIDSWTALDGPLLVQPLPSCKIDMHEKENTEAGS